jgi:hypothetical protein
MSYSFQEIDLAAAKRVGGAEQRAAFKNFHRLLCNRFGYVHDEVHWERDLLSLIEHINEGYSPLAGGLEAMNGLWSCSCEACAKARDDLEEDYRIFGVMFARRNDQGHVIRIDPKDVYLPARYPDEGRT